MPQPVSITIILPWLNSKLHAHNKGHWRRKSAATKDLRLTAKVIAIGAQRRLSDRARWLMAEVTYRFYPPDNRGRDEANMIQACKPAIDGCVDAELIVDDKWQVLRTAGVHVEIDRDNPRVELIFTEAE